MKRFLSWAFVVLLYLVLLAGTICGIVFGVKYKQRLDNSTDNQVVAEYVLEIDSLNKDIAELRVLIEDYKGSDVGVLREKLTTVEGQVTKLQRDLELSQAATQTAYNNLQEKSLEIENLKGQIVALKNSFIEKEHEMQDALYEAYSTYPSLLGIETSSNAVTGVVFENTELVDHTEGGAGFSSISE